MSKSELHDWECEIEELSGNNVDKMLEIAQDIYNTAFVRGKNHMTWEQEPCEDCISRQAVLDMAITIQTDDCSGNETMEVVTVDDVRALPSVTPTRKTGKWIDTGEISTNRRGQIVHEVICSECNGISYFRSMGNKYIGANLCPNCGSRNCQERLKGESNGSK